MLVQLLGEIPYFGLGEWGPRWRSRLLAGGKIPSARCPPGKLLVKMMYKMAIRVPPAIRNNPP